MDIRARWKRCMKPGVGKGERVQLPCSLWAHHPPSTSVCSPVQKLSRPFFFGYLQRFLHSRHDRLNPWSSAIRSTSSSSSLSGCWDLRQKVPTPSSWLVPLAITPICGLAKISLINICWWVERDLLWIMRHLHPFSLGKFQRFLELCARNWARLKDVFLINHHITGGQGAVCGQGREKVWDKPSSGAWTPLASLPC